MRQKRAVVVGGTSGIGLETVRLLVAKGWHVGVAGRNQEMLDELSAEYGEAVVCRQIDVQIAESVESLRELIAALGGMELFLLSSGIGSSNKELALDIEIATVETNATGFVRMMNGAYQYFKQSGGGHIAAITSVAGTKGLGSAPAYSATKRFQSHYIDSLAQLSRMSNDRIQFSDIRPGFVDTPLLKKERYPMLMDVRFVAKRLVRAIECNRRVAVIDRRYRLLVAVWRLIPRCLWERMRVSNG